MGKPVEGSQRSTLRCVHCRTTETPLWRTGPDGPKTLCNACGVRFKKGKLTLYRDNSGILTAVKQADTPPVVLPPPPKKPSKKPSSTAVIAAAAAAAAAASVSAIDDAPSSLLPYGDSSRNLLGTQSSPDASPAPAPTPCPSPTSLDADSSSAVSSASGHFKCSASSTRKLSATASLESTTAKKIRGRARRMTAGQLPGRYQSYSKASSVADADMEYADYRLPSPSPPSSLQSAPSSPGPYEFYLENHDEFFMPCAGPTVTYNIQASSPYQFSDQAVDNAFPDVSCLGLDDMDFKDAPPKLSLPSMAADPSSAEHFSCADDVAFTSDPPFVIDAPDRRSALITLVRDRSRSAGRCYQLCIRAVGQLGNRLTEKAAFSATSCAEDRRNFVKSFVAEHSTYGTCLNSNSRKHGCNALQGLWRTPFVTLQDRAAYDIAVDAFRAMCDCASLAVFAEDLLLQVMEEDVNTFMNSPTLLNIPDSEYGACASMQRDFAGNPVSARA